MTRKTTVSFKSTKELAQSLGFSSSESELIAMKGTVIGALDKERERRKLNNSDFAKFLGVPRSRWSSILNNPEKVTLDYLLALAARCGAYFKLSRKVA